MNEAPASGSPASNSAQASAEENRRGHARHPCAYQAMCQSAGRAWWPVAFVDLSRGGAGVLLASPVEAGAAVTFTIHTASRRVLLLRGKVCHVEPREGEWLAGCKFDRLLSEAEMAELV
jgi:ferric-dicitrate binding protein FerR (iron transport regulator)